MKSNLKRFSIIIFLLLQCSCAAMKNQKPTFDYTAFKASQPRSILVLPPINHTTEINAGLSVLSLASFPLAEAGYYVLPVALTSETFKQNGITVAEDAQSIPLPKLREIFGADAGLYITINKYGSIYRVIDSATTVGVDAKLVDLRTGHMLWLGSAHASSNEHQNRQFNNGVIGMLVSAVVNQVVNQSTDASHQVADIAVNRLLYPSGDGSMLYGPYQQQHMSHP